MLAEWSSCYQAAMLVRQGKCSLAATNSTKQKRRFHEARCSYQKKKTVWCLLIACRLLIAFVLCAKSLWSRLTLLQLYGLQPARLLCLWDSPGKNTGVGLCALFQGIFWPRDQNPVLLHWQTGSLLLAPPGKLFSHYIWCFQMMPQLNKKRENTWVYKIHLWATYGLLAISFDLLLLKNG